MTVASEISRLQCAKADICTAIENKGVTVGNITLDEYAACIDAISTGPKTGYIDLLVVGGGGAGGWYGNRASYGGGGGGAGGYIYNTQFPISSETLCHSVVVGCGGIGCLGKTYISRGGNSCFDSIVAYGGGGGVSTCASYKNGGSGGGGQGYGEAGGAIGGCGCCGQGNNGGSGGAASNTIGFGGGGGGAAESGGDAGGIGNCRYGGKGGNGCLNDISGQNVYYSGGGGGGACRGNPCDRLGLGGCGGGDGYENGVSGCPVTYATDAPCYGGGGGGGWAVGNNRGGNGCQGVIILRYHTDGSDGLLPTSFGGCKYSCGDYTIHCFTSVGGTEYFIPVFK